MSPHLLPPFARSCCVMLFPPWSSWLACLFRSLVLSSAAASGPAGPCLGSQVFLPHAVFPGGLSESSSGSVQPLKRGHRIASDASVGRICSIQNRDLDSWFPCSNGSLHSTRSLCSTTHRNSWTIRYILGLEAMHRQFAGG